ncbi:MAG: hypothetical protein J6M18_06330, partial [Actinomycetaceae bacterium]|nr:hypothetical protein [Actinomycetaceae bacterium]
MNTPYSLIAHLQHIGPQPVLTWYSSEGRMELSGNVTANHIIKISQFLHNDLWCEESSIFFLDTPLHWKSLTWALGAMMAGLHVTTTPLSQEKITVVTNQPEKYTPYSSNNYIALNMSPLA